MRKTYLVVTLFAVVTIVTSHLMSPSSGRGAVSPEDFAGACAPCGAPCPSKK